MIASTNIVFLDNSDLLWITVGAAMVLGLCVLAFLFFKR